MPQPVKLSDALVLDARLAAEAQHRSIAGQVEFWAGLGRCVEELLDGASQSRLRQVGARNPLGPLVESVEKPEGRARLKAVLDSEPYPHFEPYPARKGWLVRIEADGTRSVGRFVKRRFVTHGEEPADSPRSPERRQAGKPNRASTKAKGR